MKKQYISTVLLLLCMLIFTAACGAQEHELSASTESVSSYISSLSPFLPVNIGNYVFELKQGEDISDTALYDLTITQDGKEEIIASNIEYDYITNGKILYYVTKQESNGKTVSVINKMHIATKESVPLISGDKVHLFSCNGKYLYYGTPSDWGYWLFVYDTDSCDAKNIFKDAGDVQCSNNCLLVSKGLEDHLMNRQFSVFNPDGSEQKDLPLACVAKIDGNRIIYAVFNEDWENMKYDIYQCDLDAAQEKQLYTDLGRIPSAFFNEDITLEEELENDTD